MTNSILFIDGENFLHKVKEVLSNNNMKLGKIDFSSIDFAKLFNHAIKDYAVTRKIFYAAKLHSHPETKDVSEKLIKMQRKLRNKLLHQKFEFEITGNVRGQKIGNKIVFREKGVDVKIAVDLVSLACDKKLDVALLCSSDSDLQPAIKELRKRNVQVVYLGFAHNPNKGLTYTTNKAILLKDHEILAACGFSK